MSKPYVLHPSFQWRRHIIFSNINFYHSCEKTVFFQPIVINFIGITWCLLQHIFGTMYMKRCYQPHRGPWLCWQNPRAVTVRLCAWSVPCPTSPVMLVPPGPGAVVQYPQRRTGKAELPWRHSPAHYLVYPSYQPWHGPQKKHIKWPSCSKHLYNKYILCTHCNL